MANFRVTIKKSVAGYPWVNSYRIRAADLNEAVTVGEDLVIFEKKIHTDVVRFRNVKVSPDPNPSGTGFRSTPLVGYGERVTGSYRQAGAGIVGFAAYEASAGGHYGKKMYRYSLFSHEFIADGDGYEVDPTADIVDDFGDASVALTTALDDLTAALLIGDEHHTSTNVLSLVAVSTLDRHHGYFDKPDE